jgi:hypothetical protein
LAPNRLLEKPASRKYLKNKEAGAGTRTPDLLITNTDPEQSTGTDQNQTPKKQGGSG